VDKIDRYLRNKNLIMPEEQIKLSKMKVVVLGCGGLGGYIIEMLARIGVGELILVDFDVFDESNLNRQIISTEENLGISKVEEAERRVRLINSNIKVFGMNLKIDKKNIKKIIKGTDLVLDALDSISLKIIVEEACSLLGIPMIHGAIGGRVAQVAVIRPGEFILKKIYGDIKEGIEGTLGNPSFTPAIAASVQVSEALKILLNSGNTLEKEILYMDLENNTFSNIKL
jgi:molybdopterin/thiamine biosynthesis adenylyltransferase